jgi:hypothetical protein
MNHDQIQQEISIMKKMVEKAKRDSAESGRLYLFIGTACIVYVVVVMILEGLRLFSWTLPAMIAMTVVCAIAGYFIVAREERKAQVMTWPKKINRAVIFICSMAMVLTGFVFPVTKLYAWSLSPVFAALLFGIMLFTSGAIYEFPVFYWSGLISWAGACVMAFTQNSTFPVRGVAILIILIAGFIVPAAVLNKKYKNRGHGHAS